MVDTANDWKSKNEADRHQRSYRPVPGTQRTDGIYGQTRQAVDVEASAVLQESLSLDELMLLQLRGIRIGLELLNGLSQGDLENLAAGET